MKEFCSQTGGRQTYVDDIVNLQELALAMTSIFDGCDNFVISGCTRSGQNISPGYVYINGKIRRFAGATGITSFPQYIYETNAQESVAYASGTDKVGRNNYGCTMGKTVPSTIDELTGAAPQFIQYNSSGVKGLKEAFIGRFTILASHTTVQQLASNLTVTGYITASGEITTNAGVTIKSGNKTTRLFYDTDGNMVFESNANNNKQSLIFTDNSIQISCAGQIVATYAENLITHHIPTQLKTMYVGAACMEDNHIYNKTNSLDDAELHINMRGYNGGTTKYRDTIIGNGRGVEIFRAHGDTRSASIYGTLHLDSPQAVALTLKSNLLANNSNLLKHISWVDAANETMAQIGFLDNSDQFFSIVNHTSNISINASTYVDLGPEIREGGVALSEKYVSTKTFANAIAGIALKDTVYTTSEANKKFATLAGGLYQFVLADTPPLVLRAAIDAVSMTEVSQKHAQLDSLLADMATDESRKRAICRNIGASYGDAFQEKLKDTGWVELTSTLKVRQIGNIVSIQGTVSPASLATGSTLFTLPNNIDPPAHSPEFHHTLGRFVIWSTTFQAGTRKCHVSWKDGEFQLRTIDYSLTYMV